MSKLKEKEEETHKHRHRSSSSSSSSSSPSSSDDYSSESSDSSDDDSTRKHKKGPKYSHKDKHLPKNLYFTGGGKLTWIASSFSLKGLLIIGNGLKKKSLTIFLIVCQRKHWIMLKR